MLTRVSNTKLVDPDMVVAVERTFNKQGYTLKMVSGEEVFVSDEEYANLTFDNGSYDSKRVKSEVVSGTANVALDTAFASSSFIDLATGPHSASSPLTCTLNVSSINEDTHHQLTYWNALFFTITNDTGSTLTVRKDNASTDVADDGTFTITMSASVGGTITFYRAEDKLFIVGDGITIIFN